MLSTKEKKTFRQKSSYSVDVNLGIAMGPSVTALKHSKAFLNHLVATLGKM